MKTFTNAQLAAWRAVWANRTAAAQSAYEDVSEPLNAAMKEWGNLRGRESERDNPDFGPAVTPDPGAVMFRTIWKAAGPEVATIRVKGDIPDRREVLLDRTLEQIAVLAVRADRLVTGR